jgi:hypothetical protein
MVVPLPTHATKGTPWTSFCNRVCHDHSPSYRIPGERIGRRARRNIRFCRGKGTSRRGHAPGGRQLSHSRKPTGSHSTEKETVNPLDRDAEQFVLTVLSLYQQLPETPALPSSRDRLHAYQLQQRRLPLSLIETALLLGSLRRLLRPPDAPALSPIPSLAYFGPVIDERHQRTPSQSCSRHLH